MARRGNKAAQGFLPDRKSATESRKRVILTPRESCDEDEYQSSSAPQTAHERGRCHLVPAVDVKSGMGDDRDTPKQVTLKANPCQYQDYRMKHMIAHTEPLHCTRGEMRSFNALNIGCLLYTSDAADE